MTDTPTDGPAPQEPPVERGRVRRGRSSKRSRRSSGVRTHLPFTSLRFMRPRMPGPGQALALACGLAALGLSAWAIGIAGEAGASLTQSQALFSMSTRGATVGRIAADRLAAEARADAAQTLAAEDLAEQRRTQRPTPLVGVTAGDGYAHRSEDDQAIAPPGLAPSPYAPPYGQPSYGRPSDVQPQSGPGSSASGTPVMGYTLPTARPQ